jgi:tetratricopeptide (TPR) repeat protein
MQVVNGRYYVHELLRQYAEANLVQSPDAVGIYQKHCRYYASFASKWGKALTEGQQLEALNQLEDELENIRIAFVQAAHAGDEQAIDELINMWCFFDIRSLWQTGIDLFETAAKGVSDPIIRAKIAGRASILAIFLGLSEKALGLAQESYAILEEVDVDGELALPLTTLSIMAFFQGDIETAEQYCQESMAIAKQFSNTYRLSMGFGHLSLIAQNRGDLVEAKRYLEQQLILAEQVNDYMSRTIAYLSLTEIAMQAGELDEAVVWCQKTIEAAEAIHQRHFITGALGHMGVIARMQQRYDDAKQLLTECLTRSRRQGNPQYIVRYLRELGNVAVAQNHLDQARQYYHEALLIVLKIEFIYDGLLLLNDIAAFFMQWGQAKRGTEILRYVQCNAATRHDTRQEAERLLEQLQASSIWEGITPAASEVQTNDWEALLTSVLKDLDQPMMNDSAINTDDA